MEIKDWREGLPKDFPEESRVWVYQNNRPFSKEEEQKLLVHLKEYTTHWMSHSRPVKGWATVLFHQFILIMSDDTADRLCGSAVDDSIRFVKGLESRYGWQLLNRMQMGFLLEEGVTIFPFAEIEKALDEQKISGNSLFFNNAVTTKGELLHNWSIALKESYLWGRVAGERQT